MTSVTPYPFSDAVFCFGIVHDFLFDGMDGMKKRPLTFSIGGLTDGMGFPDFAAGTVCRKQIVSAAKCAAGIAIRGPHNIT